MGVKRWILSRHAMLCWLGLSNWRPLTGPLYQGPARRYNASETRAAPEAPLVAGAGVL